MSEPYTVIPLSPLRKVIARRVSEAQRTIPHFRVTKQIRVEALCRLRRELNDESARTRLSLTDLLVKASALALNEVPQANVCWAESCIHQFKTADICVVTSIDDGVVTPVVRGANQKTVWEISAEVRDLVSRARRKALRLEEIEGGSFSISNLGMFGVDQFDATINAPQCAILAVGGVTRTAFPKETAVELLDTITVTLACDHRAIDGITAARFLQALTRRVEHPQELTW